jgi:hypothetical protein
MTAQAGCAAHLRNGDQCLSVAVDGGRCAHHRDLAAEVGEETLPAGRHARRRRQESTLARVVAEPKQDVERPARNANDGTGVTPSDVRPRLAAAAAANVEHKRESRRCDDRARRRRQPAC